ncbi:hypothetical protein DPMN_097274 [Dreissena polymorpha]|uniref:Uncharacterized protein n=1 Tax=Dreissena polymorpha TaxID=45954 RepID=A0A9D4LB10_DREPO|nr:hypothetical protein DPMN_097274 [Dreissena polymorpha]
MASAREADSVQHNELFERPTRFNIASSQIPDREDDSVQHSQIPDREADSVQHSQIPVREADSVQHNHCEKPTRFNTASSRGRLGSTQPVQEANSVQHSQCERLTRFNIASARGRFDSTKPVRQTEKPERDADSVQHSHQCKRPTRFNITTNARDLQFNIASVQYASQCERPTRCNIASAPNRLESLQPVREADTSLTSDTRKLTCLMQPQDIIRTNVLTKFHEESTINMNFRVLTRINPPTPGGHVFQTNGTIFELIQDIYKTNHAEVHRRRYYYSHTMKNAPPHGGHVFQPIGSIFELIQDSIGTSVVTKLHEDWTINVTLGMLTRKMPLPLAAKFFQPTGIIFELVQHIIRTHLLTKFHEDRTINVASSVKNAPPPGGHVFQATITIFEVVQNITKTNLLIKFHKDLTINVASRVLTRQISSPHDTRRTMQDGQRRSQKLTMRTKCSGEL